MTCLMRCHARLKNRAFPPRITLTERTAPVVRILFPANGIEDAPPGRNR